MISVIIPTYNEELEIAKTLSVLFANRSEFIKEIIVVDGGSTDKTKDTCASMPVSFVCSPQKGRASQMNFGASLAKGNVLYFLHADSIPPGNFAEQILDAIHQGKLGGCFRLAFDRNHWFLKANAWFTRFDIDAFRYGDQSLFVTKELFARCGKFDENLVAFEDNEIIARLKQFGKFKILSGTVKTSARKYRDNGVFFTQFTFYYLYILYKAGVPQRNLVSIYKTLIKQDKL